METRYYKVLIRKPGGNASRNAKGYNLSLPPKWAQKLGITEAERTVKLTFNGTSVKIEKANTEEVPHESETI